MQRLWVPLLPRLLGTAAIALMLVSWSAVSPTQASTQTSTSCQLHAPQGNVQHVIYIQFDNTHFTRDNPNIPSDLEQMPHLLNFIQSNGTLLSNYHTPLIAHTGTDILTSLTGVYGDRHGVPISNSYRYYNPDGSTGTGVSFAYWTAPIYDPTTQTPSDTKYNMLNEKGKNASAPWVPFTRAGCNFGGVATANMVLENIGIDIPTVFGASSPEAAEVKTDPKQAFADFVGIGIHCAKGTAPCQSNSAAKADLLPDEPGGYTGYSGLFGHKYVAPQISPNDPLKDLNGNIIKDDTGHTGFPGFDGMSASVSLAYVAAMQEHNIPVTYAYISDAHDNHAQGRAFGPGEAGYTAQLKAYDDAFAKFFTRLQKDGITARNTLFVFTADEGDHFVGGAPSPANCNGVSIPCTYKQIGEINANMTGLLATQQGIKTPFKVHADSAPNIYITGNPARDADVTRQFERGSWALTATNPLNGKTEQIANYLADPVEMHFLHMITSDPARTPTFTLFAKPDYYLFAGAPNCDTPCVTENPAFAWNHGDISPDINVTWLGLVGPGIQKQGVNKTVWADQTDARPTMLELLGLKDDYISDGRVLFEVLTDAALPKVVRENKSDYIRLAATYKQLNAPLGSLAASTWQISTRALSSNAPNDATYKTLEDQLQLVTELRNGVTSQMIVVLNAAEFGGKPNAQQAQALLIRGNGLFQRVTTLAHSHLL